MRLDKYLAHANAGSRKEVKQMIRKGFVKVNGEVCKKDDVHIKEDSDFVTLYEEEIKYQQFYYVMMHKPQGYLSATKDANQPTIMDLLDVVLPKDMFPVGRLDIDTEGLLLLCNDGALSHELLSPKKHVEKEYIVESKYPLSEEDIITLSNGTICLDEETIKPAKVDVVDSCLIHLTISQGKYHQIKRMLQAVGNEVVYLKRIRMGSLCLDETLELGEWRFLTEEEIAQLKQPC